MSNKSDTQHASQPNYLDPSRANQIRRDTMVLVLAGGEGSRLKGLTKWRAKPGVPFGGKYRIIDFALSNCINSGLRRIGVLTQYKSHSLIRHLQRGWGFLRHEIGEFVEIIPAQQRMSDKQWYKGTADAIYQNLDIVNQHGPEYVLILGGDHIYKMDYSRMLAYHIEKDADITVGCIEVSREEASEFGVMSVDEYFEIKRFAEKPADPEAMPGRPDMALASMGIYVFSRRKLVQWLMEDAESDDTSHDFGKDIIPKNVAASGAKVMAYPFQDKRGNVAYWRDVGSVDSYWEANMELCSVEPPLNLYSRNWPVWTYQTQQPPAKFIFDDAERRGEAIDSLVSAGCIISGARIKRSIIFSESRVDEGSLVKDSVVLPKVKIGRNCTILNAIIDKSCHIRDGLEIGVHPEEDAKLYHVTEKGVVLVTPGMLGQDLFLDDLLK